MQKELSCGILPLKFDGKDHQVFLVQHRKGHYWGFPKGHVEPGETHLETASRELKEETGLEVLEWIETTPFSEDYTFQRDGETIQKIVYYFTARVSVEHSLDSKELLDGKWLSFDEAEAFITFENSRRILSELRHFLTMI